VLDSFPFDPLGQNSSEQQLKEIKNGRLAMVRTSDLAILVKHQVIGVRRSLGLHP
jgi:hypothetical protein